MTPVAVLGPRRRRSSVQTIRSVFGAFPGRSCSRGRGAFPFSSAPGAQAREDPIPAEGEPTRAPLPRVRLVAAIEDPRGIPPPTESQGACGRADPHAPEPARSPSPSWTPVEPPAHPRPRASRRRLRRHRPTRLRRVVPLHPVPYHSAGSDDGGGTCAALRDVGALTVGRRHVDGREARGAASAGERWRGRQPEMQFKAPTL